MKQRHAREPMPTNEELAEPAPSASTGSTRVQQVDLLRAIAIVSVLVLHSLDATSLSKTWSTLHVCQAVPVFLVLMGYTAQLSLGRRLTGTRLRSFWPKSYLVSRFWTIVAPFACFYVLARVVALSQPARELRPFYTAFEGWMPFQMPGDYFVNVTFQWILVAPLVYWMFRAKPVATTVGVFVSALLFDLALGRIDGLAELLGLHSYCIVHYLPFIILGFWVAGWPSVTPLQRRVLLVGALGSALYLLHARLWPDQALTFYAGYGQQNLLASFYAMALVLLGLRYLPGKPSSWTGAAALVGKASYHILLVQMVYFVSVEGALYNRRGLPLAATLVNLVVCIALGVLAYSIQRYVTQRARTRVS